MSDMFGIEMVRRRRPGLCNAIYGSSTVSTSSINWRIDTRIAVEESVVRRGSAKRAGLASGRGCCIWVILAGCSWFPSAARLRRSVSSTFWWNFRRTPGKRRTCLLPALRSEAGRIGRTFGRGHLAGWRHMGAGSQCPCRSSPNCGTLKTCSGVRSRRRFPIAGRQRERAEERRRGRTMIGSPWGQFVRR
jgi:hypothetical protein